MRHNLVNPEFLNTYGFFMKPGWLSSPKSQKRVYHLHAEPLVEIDNWLEPYRQFWSDKLDSLENLLNKEDEEEIRTLPQQRLRKKKG